MARQRDQRAANVAYYWRNREMELSRVRIRQASAVEFCESCAESPVQTVAAVLRPIRWTLTTAIRRRNRSTSWQVAQCSSRHSDSWPKSQNATSSVPTAIGLGHRCSTGNTLRPGITLAARQKTSSGTARIGVAKQRCSISFVRQHALIAVSDSRRVAMDFDHRPGTTKTERVTGMIGRAGTPRILAEAAKCDIVCANCHRERTYARRTRRFDQRE